MDASAGDPCTAADNMALPCAGSANHRDIKGRALDWLEVARDEFLKGHPSPRVRGCDANIFSADWARKGFSLDVEGLPFSQVLVGEADHGRFALASMLDYIEHTYTPLQDLQKLHELVAPRGVASTQDIPP